MSAKRNKQTYRYQPPDNQFCNSQIGKRGNRISGTGERQKYNSLSDGKGKEVFIRKNNASARNRKQNLGRMDGGGTTAISEAYEKIS